jgi:hypothetical protein
MLPKQIFSGDGGVTLFRKDKEVGSSPHPTLSQTEREIEQNLKVIVRK